MSEATESEVSASSIHEPIDQTARDQRINFWVSVIEGGAFMGGLLFLAGQTLLPDIIRQLGGSPLLIAAAPSLSALGYWVCPILSAHWVDRMHRYKPFIILCGVFHRIPYLLATIALYLAASGTFVGGALAAVVLTPVLAGIAGGLSVTAWQQLIARCIPENRRASLFATRYIVTCVLGVTAGLTAKYLYAHCSLLFAYATLHLITLALLMVSFFVFLATREPASPAPAVHTLTLLENLTLMPRLIAGDPTFRRYLWSRTLRNGTLILTPFLAIYARDHLHQPESFLGTLTISNMVGAILGNFWAARLGDRVGGKIPSQLALVLYILAAAWSIVAGTSIEFTLIFALLGMALYVGEVGAFTLMLEILPQRNRATYLAITVLANVPAVILAGWISSAIWKHTGGITLLAALTIVTLICSMLLLHPIKDPRRHAGAGRPPAASA